MSNIVSDPEAKAIEATANATTALAGIVSNGLNMASAVGGYVFKIVGTLPEDLIGLAGADYVSQQRRRNLARMAQKTARIIEETKAPELTEPSASLVVPLLQAAADENREELQDLWAALLARAMTGGGRRIRRQFFAILRDMEPSDAVVLKLIYKRNYEASSKGQDFGAYKAALTDAGIGQSEQHVCEHHLIDLGCVSEGGIVTPLSLELLALVEPS